jgi:hypothetical protein
MTHSTPPYIGCDEPNDSSVPDDAVRHLAEAVAGLSNDGAYFVAALTEKLMSLKPVEKSKLTKAQKRFLIESGSFTAEGLAAMQRDVAKGSLQVDAAETWLSQLCATLSLHDVSQILDRDEDTVRTAVSEGRLYAVEITGRLRFPIWQLDIRAAGRTIPGLTEIIEAIPPTRSWLRVSAFFATRQSSLVAEGRQTPTQWLSDNHDVEAVIEIITSDGRW